MRREPSLTRPAVWRYLQEAGFGNAALQLSRCWLRDPETVPFAKNVDPHTLIRILQDGMCFDQLQAEATNVCAPLGRMGRRLTSVDGAAIPLRPRPRAALLGAQWRAADPRHGHPRPRAGR
jgi:hypothetical protein